MKVEPRQSNLSNQLAEAIGCAVVRGDMVRDQPFPTEAELGERFQVSRTAVREAVKMLSAKGLIASKPRQGIRVLPEESWNILDPDVLRWSLTANPTHALLKEFFQMRVAIEPEAAALAAVNGSAGRLAAIVAALDGMRRAEPNSDASLENDVEFHVAILYATENRFYIRMRDFIRTALGVSIRFTTPTSVNYEHTVLSHAQTCEAIVSRQPDLARRRMLALIQDALTYLDAG